MNIKNNKNKLDQNSKIRLYKNCLKNINPFSSLHSLVSLPYSQKINGCKTNLYLIIYLSKRILGVSIDSQTVFGYIVRYTLGVL